MYKYFVFDMQACLSLSKGVVQYKNELKNSVACYCGISMHLTVCTLGQNQIEHINVLCIFTVTVEALRQLDDPDILMHQLIPKSYMDLRSKVHLKALDMKQNKMAPMMAKREF